MLQSVTTSRQATPLAFHRLKHIQQLRLKNVQTVETKKIDATLTHEKETTMALVQAA